MAICKHWFDMCPFCEVESLTAKNNDLERLHAAVTIQVTQRQHKIDKLTTERDALKADAERYRWLRNDSYDSEIGVWECRDMENRRIVLAGEELDDSVDTAIQGAKK